MRPLRRASIPGSAAWITFHVPVRLTSMTRLQSSSASVSLAPVRWTPAAVTTTPGAPSSASTRATKAPTAPRSTTSSSPCSADPSAGPRSHVGDREAIGGQPLHDRRAQPAAGAGDDRHPLLRGRWTDVVHGRRATLQGVCGALRGVRQAGVIAFSSHRSMRPSIATTPTGR